MIFKFNSEWIKKNFYFIDCKYKAYQLIPYNTDMFDYYNNITYYGNNDTGLDYTNKCLQFRDKESEELLNKSICSIHDGEEIIFEFPDEETAFYFKLKFC